MGLSRLANSCQWIQKQLAEKAVSRLTLAGTAIAGTAYGALQIIRGSDDFRQKDSIKENITTMGAIGSLVMSSAALLEALIFLAKYRKYLDMKENFYSAGTVFLCIASVIFTASNVNNPNQAGSTAIVATIASLLANNVTQSMWSKQRNDAAGRASAESLLPETADHTPVFTSL